MGTGPQEGPGKSDEALAGVSASAGAVARGNGYQLSVETVLYNIARVELVGIALGAFRAKDDGGLERSRAARSPVRDEVQIRIALGFARQIGGWGGRLAREYDALIRRKIAFDERHFLRRLRQWRKIRARLQRVADEQQIRGT